MFLTCARLSLIYSWQLQRESENENPAQPLAGKENVGRRRARM